MEWQNDIPKMELVFGASSGTTTVTEIIIGEDDRLIEAETVTMLNWRLLPMRSEVIASLDRSIRKHAEVWSELSKY
jgi:hypothetical protein